ncbi:MAG: hypothetical protein V3V00_15640 [Saprospiraceae bacterium]
MDRDNLTKHLVFIKEIIDDALKMRIAGKKFTGQINICINFTDGGISNTDGEIKAIIKKNK